MLKKAQRFTSAGAPRDLMDLLRSGMSIAELRALSPLEENAQKLVDQAVVRVGLERLTVVADILGAGLRFPLADPLSVMEVQWEQISKTGGAQRTMSPEARGEYQAPDRNIKRVPIYITTDDFSVNIRTLRASQRIGTPIDTTLVEDATRRVNEALEDAMINGTSLVSGGYSTPGLINAPNVNTFHYGGGEAWDVAGHDGNDILTDVLGMIAVMQGDNMFGPYNLYVNTTYGNKLNDDFKANSDLTIMQRLEQINVGGRNLRVVVADRIPADNTILVQMTSDVVDIIDGQRPTVVPWASPSGMTLFWMVMAIVVPRVKDTYDGTSGILVGSKS